MNLEGLFMETNKINFSKKNLLQEMVLSKEEMEKYYKLLREYNYNNSDCKSKINRTN